MIIKIINLLLNLLFITLKLYTFYHALDSKILHCMVKKTIYLHVVITLNNAYIRICHIQTSKGKAKTAFVIVFQVTKVIHRM